LRHHDISPEIVELVRDERWDFSMKVRQAPEDGDFTTYDLSRCVLEGGPRKRERDEKRTAVDGWKYTIWGPSTSGHPFYICGKIRAYPRGRLFFLITAHGRH
jgi:hypothetical protein